MRKWRILVSKWIRNEAMEQMRNEKRNEEVDKK